MKLLVAIAVLFSFINFSRADFCQDNFTLSEFPNGILEEVLSIITKGTINDFFGCPDDTEINEDSVNLWLWTRNNTDAPILLDKNNPTQIDPSKPIQMLIPGWLCNVSNDRIPELKNAYLERYDSNVIGVDWSKYAIDLYVNSFCFIPLIAQVIGRVFCHMQTNLNVDLNTVHVVGHSMGGQMSGFIGQEVQKQCKASLGRITAADPAGPLYQGLSEGRRLSGQDADFVDVIHTNQNYLGYYGNCGTVDHYPNCGTFQPGCLKIDKSTPIESIINLPAAAVGCNHLRSLDYMVESIYSNKFIATSCTLCPSLPFIGVCTKDILFPSKTIMGEDAPKNPPYHKFYLRTNSKSPFARG